MVLKQVLENLSHHFVTIIFRGKYQSIYIYIVRACCQLHDNKCLEVCKLIIYNIKELRSSFRNPSNNIKFLDIYIINYLMFMYFLILGTNYNSSCEKITSSLLVECSEQDSLCFIQI